MIEVVLNGEKRSFDTALNITELLTGLGIKPEGVVVEQNMKVIKKTERETSFIKDGDKIEIVQFIGGGCDSIPEGGKVG